MPDSVTELQQRVARLEESVAEAVAQAGRIEAFAEGLLRIWFGVLPLLLKEHPSVAARVIPMLEGQEERYRRACTGRKLEEGETREGLEPAALLARILRTTGPAVSLPTPGDPYTTVTIRSRRGREQDSPPATRARRKK